MCLICIKDDLFGSRGPTQQARLLDRARKIKEILREAEENKSSTCFIGDAMIDQLKTEQFELAKQL